MRTISFEKWQGTGNDFVIVEAPSPSLSAADVRAICDRHFGVGADGVLIVGAGTSPGSAGTMIVQNADGSRPEMCGNGLRCVAAYLAAKNGGSSRSMVIDTDAGPRGCEVFEESVAIGMGKGVSQGDVTVQSAGRELSFSRVSMGNPHAVTFAKLHADALHTFGPSVAIDERFPEGTNVEFATMKDDASIDVEVWERGVGPTLACGTGACAVAVLACVRGLAHYDEKTIVRLPGGPLTVTVSRDLSVRMEGPAVRVFKGEVSL